jgi:hypothetical protein
MFHYQYCLVIGIAIIFLWTIKQLNIKRFISYLLGLGIGFSPLIFFELRHDFYNTRTILFFFQQGGTVGGDSWTRPHYYISILLIMLAIFISTKIIRINTIFWLLNSILLIWSLLIYTPTPTHGFGMTENWNYETETQVAEKILELGCPKDFEVAETISNDSRAYDLRYLLQIRKCVPMAVDKYSVTSILYLVAPKSRPPQEENIWEVSSMGKKVNYEVFNINSSFNLWKISKN